MVGILKFGMAWNGLIWFDMVWYGLVKVLKLNSRPLINQSINDKGGHRAARAAKKGKTRKRQRD